MEEDEQMITPPSVIKIVTGQGPSPADVQGMLRKLPYIALYITRYPGSFILLTCY